MQWVCLSKKSLSPFEAPRKRSLSLVSPRLKPLGKGACPSFPEGTGSFQGTKPLGKRSLSLNESPLSFPEGTGSFQGTKPLGKRSLSLNESPLEPWTTLRMAQR
jgi:hypothetical protein